MPTYIDEDELFADTGQTDVSKAPPGATYIDESELGLEGRPTTQKSLGGQVLDFVTDPEELKTYGKSLVSLGTAAADLILGIPGQGARVASDIYERGKGLVTGRSRAETEAAVQEAKGMVPEAWSSPLQSLARMGGVEPWNQEIVGRTLERGAEFVGEHSGGLLTKTDAESLLETAMLGGVTHVPRQAVRQIMEPKQRLGAENRATYAPEAAEPPAPFEPMGIADRGRTPVPPTPEEAIARSQKRVKDARKAFADKEAVAQMEELANARQIRVGEALMGEETVQVTGEARRGADGKLYTPVIRGGTQMEVPSSDLAPKPQVGLEHLAPEPLAATRELGTGKRMTEGKVLGEPPAPLATALEKVRSGQSFQLDATERIAMRALERAEGNIVGPDGKPLSRQAGAIDPRLLAALGIASGATLLALNPEYLEKLGTVGLIGATMLGSDRSIGALKQRTKPYTFALWEDVPPGKIEFNRQEILDRLKRPNISAQEKAVVERVLGDKQRITSEELVGGMLEETANWKLTPEGTQQYADYGLDNIGRSRPSSIDSGGTLLEGDATTIKYRLPEHMQMTDANHFGDDRLFGWTRSFKEDGVRHVVELQSDLAQKTRGALSPEKLREAYARMDDITGRMMQLKQEMGKATDPAENLGRRKEFADLVKEREGLQEAVQATGIESQLSPILKNWPRRLIREELAQAAQTKAAAQQEVVRLKADLAQLEAQLAGKQKRWPPMPKDFIENEIAITKEAIQKAEAVQPETHVRFASADTVAKVEGWPRITAEDITTNVRNETRRLEAIRGMEPSPIRDAYIRDSEARLEAFKNQPEGFSEPGHQRIYDRYAGEISRYLKGLGGKEVTDAQGHTWIEVPTAAVETPFGPRVKMLGRADPALLASVAGSATGAGLAAYFAEPDKKVMATVLGAVGGLALTSVGGRRAMEGVLQGASNTIGHISTDLKNMSPALHHRHIKHELNTLKRTHDELKIGDAFFAAMEKAKGNLLLRRVRTNPVAELEKALVRNDFSKVATELKRLNNPAMSAAWPKVRAQLERLGREGAAQGLYKTPRDEYFPRSVKDVKGLQAVLKVEDRTALEKELSAGEAKAIKAGRGGLDDFEKSAIINDYLQRKGASSFLPSFAKGRRINELTDELLQFYHTPLDTYHHYVTKFVREAEAAKFFGTELRKAQKGGHEYTNYDKSIGELILKEREAGRLTEEQLEQLRGLEKARFGGGNKPMWWFWQDAKNLASAGLLGNMVAAVGQYADIAPTVALYGFGPSLESAIQLARGKPQLRAGDLGLINHVAEEFVSSRPTARLLDWAFSHSLLGSKFTFGGADIVMKEHRLNAAVLKAQRQARAGDPALKAEYGEAFGADFPKLVKDLKEGLITPEVLQYGFHELSRTQPLSKLEMSKWELENPNGRMLLALKSWVRKQGDYVRRDAYQRIRSGKPSEVKKGLMNLTKYGVALGVGGATMAQVQNWMLGRDDALEAGDVFEHMAKTFALSGYTRDKIAHGKPIEALTNLAIPPYKMFDELSRLDPKVMRYLPDVGPLLYAHFGGGKEDYKIAQLKAERLEKRDEQEKLKPWLKVERLKRQAERKERARAAARKLLSK